MEQLEQLRSLVEKLEKLDNITKKLDRVRLIHETTEDTLDRVIRLASERICKECRGYRTAMHGGKCLGCSGTGIVAVGKL